MSIDTISPVSSDPFDGSPSKISQLLRDMLAEDGAHSRDALHDTLTLLEMSLGLPITQPSEYGTSSPEMVEVLKAEDAGRLNLPPTDVDFLVGIGIKAY